MVARVDGINMSVSNATLLRINHSTFVVRAGLICLHGLRSSIVFTSLSLGIVRKLKVVWALILIAMGYSAVRFLIRLVHLL